MASPRYFTVTYTHQKLKKHKSYKDGFLTLDAANRRLSLYDDSHHIIDSLVLAPGYELNAGDEIETERYLVVLDVEDTVGHTKSGNNDNSNNNSNSTSEYAAPARPISAPQLCKRSKTRIASGSGFKVPTTVLQPQNPPAKSTVQADLAPEIAALLADEFADPAADHRWSLTRALPSTAVTGGWRGAAVSATRTTTQRTPAPPMLPPVQRPLPQRSDEDLLALLLDVGNAPAAVAAAPPPMSLPPPPSPAFPAASAVASVWSAAPADNSSPVPPTFRQANAFVAASRLPPTLAADPPSAAPSAPPRPRGKPTGTLATQAQRWLQQRHGAAVRDPTDFGDAMLDDNDDVRPATIATAANAASAAATSSSRAEPFRVPQALFSANIKALAFPSADVCAKVAQVQRQAIIPAEFDTAFAYSAALQNALMEQLNDMLLELGKTYHEVLAGLDTQHLVGVGRRGASAAAAAAAANVPHCMHGPARMQTVKKDGPSKGRVFYCCPKPKAQGCNFFVWADQVGSNTGRGSNQRRAVPVHTFKELEDLMGGRDIQLYAGCTLQEKRGQWGGGRNGDVHNSKPELMIGLTTKRKTPYGKGDVWIISSDLHFSPATTCLAISTFFGPTSDLQLSVQAVAGFHPSLLRADPLFAIQAFNAGGELSCLDNIRINIKPNGFPLLPSLLTLRPRQEGLEPQLNKLILPRCDVSALAEEYAARHKLNPDQAAVLHRMAASLPCWDDGSEAPPTQPIVMVHGVYGSGKSFLIAIILCFLHDVFQRNEVALDGDPTASYWKVLVSSTTNVAVDRILMGLLELDFDQFVRVGSAKKIAKPVLPYSTHGSASADQAELKELRAMLKTELTKAERTSVLQTMERLRRGDNRNKLASTRIVGVTCAAATFACMEQQRFPVLVLDECCQMTEPNALLPMAGFGTDRLLLVGDPKQLCPTVAGSESAHSSGLEQTLFHRLLRMGHEAVMLRTQYRCHPAIGEVSNKLFYERQLLHGTPASDRAALVPGLPPLRFLDMCHGEERRGAGGSYWNMSEAKLAALMVDHYCNRGWVSPEQIGIICLYKAQAEAIQDILRGGGGASGGKMTAAEAAPSLPATRSYDVKAVQISTVDAFQGGEKDVIIVSCVRTAATGFIDDERRVNVALTRAKRHLLVLGNAERLRQSGVWCKVVAHCKEQPGGFYDGREHEAKIMEEEETTPTPPDLTRDEEADDGNELLDDDDEEEEEGGEEDEEEVATEEGEEDADEAGSRSASTSSSSPPRLLRRPKKLRKAFDLELQPLGPSSSGAEDDDGDDLRPAFSRDNRRPMGAKEINLE